MNKIQQNFQVFCPASSENIPSPQSRALPNPAHLPSSIGKQESQPRAFTTRKVTRRHGQVLREKLKQSIANGCSEMAIAILQKMLNNKSILLMEAMDYAIYLKNKPLLEKLLNQSSDLHPDQELIAQRLLTEWVFTSPSKTDLYDYFTKRKHPQLVEAQLRKILSSLESIIMSDECYYELVARAIGTGSVEIKKIAQKHLGKYYEAGLAYYLTKSLGHFMGVDHSTKINGNRFGSVRMPFGLGRQIFTQTIQGLPPKVIKEEVRDQITQITNPAVSTNEYLTRICNGDLVIFPIQGKTHVTTLAFYRGYLMKINRGEGSNPVSSGISIYKYNPEKVTKEILLKLLHHQDGLKYYSEKFNREMILGVPIRIHMSPQKVENCSVVSLKAIILGVEYIKKINSPKPKTDKKPPKPKFRQGGLKTKQERGKTRAMYKHFTRRLREESLREYLPRLRSLKCSDKTFISLIEEKAMNKKLELPTDVG